MYVKIFLKKTKQRLSFQLKAPTAFVWTKLRRSFILKGKVWQMKINQLFGRILDEEMLMKILNCYGLRNLDDKHTFKKHDLVLLKTVEKLIALKPELEKYYLPCKAKLYLENITEKKSITILRQILRLFNFYLFSKEKNIQSRKIIFYTLTSDKEYDNIMNITQQFPRILNFD